MKAFTRWKSQRLPPLSFIIVLLWGTASLSSAATLIWDGSMTNAASYATGPWNGTTANWYTGSIDSTYASGSAVLFEGTSSGSPAVVTLSGAQNAASLGFNTSGYDIVASTGNALTVTGTTTLASGITAEIDGPVSLGAVGIGTNTLASAGNTAALTLTGGGTVGSVTGGTLN